MSKLTTIYKSVLRYAGMDVDEKGYVYNVLGDRKEPANIDGKRIVLPVDNQLKSFNPDEKVIFHPLMENILRGESETIQKLKDLINIKLNYTIGMIGQQLLNLVASEELHSQLDPDQSELFLSIKECDAKTINNWIMLMVGGSKTKSDRLFTNVYLKRGGTLHDKRYARVGIVSFPFYDELINDKVDKIRVKDKETFKQLMYFMFPGLDNPLEYSYGSNNQTAPFLDCLMNTSSKIVSRLNDLLAQYGNWIEGSDALVFDSEWIEYFNDLAAYDSEIRQIPMQQGNEGSIVLPDNKQLGFTPVTQIPNQPTTQPTPPAVVTTERGVDFRSLMASNPGLGSGVMPQFAPQYPPPPQYPCAPPAFALPAVMQPQPVYPPQQPMYPQQQYQQYPQQQQYQQYPPQQPQYPQQYPQGGYAQNRLYG